MLTGLGKDELKLNNYAKIDSKRSENKTPKIKFEKDMKNFQVIKQITTNKL